jgi:hypothetical protein
VQVQTFGAALTAKPVVTLLSGTAYSKVWYQAEDFDNSVVASEKFALLTHDAECADATVVSTTLTLDNAGHDTGIAIAAGTPKDLYLKITLGGVAGKSGSGTLTILGES